MSKQPPQQAVVFAYNNLNMKKTFFAILLLTTLSVASQTGRVIGQINDGEFNEAMAFASVLVKNTTTGVSSDFDGNYVLELDEGIYTLVFSYVGYSVVEITEVNIEAGQETIVNTTLFPNSLETVLISTTARQNTATAILSLQKESVTLLDGLSIESIKKTGAGDVAGAIKNVPGVSVEGGKYVYVRGLGDRYTKTMLNGMDVPGLDPDRNSLQLDIFPTNILDNLLVVKSASAEYPSDFTGGIVDIVTKDFPSKASHSISFGTGYNSSMHFQDNFLSYKGSSTDALGFDNGQRNRPISRYQPIPGTFENNSALTTLTNLFDKQLAADRGTSSNDFSFGFTTGNQFNLKNDKQWGYQLASSYNNENVYYRNRIDGTYQKDPDSSVLEPIATRTTVGNEGIKSVLWNSMAGLVYKGQKSKYKLNLIHLQNGESSAGYFEQALSQDGVGGGGFETIFKDALLYTQRSVTSALLGGKHSGDGDWVIEWKIAPTLNVVLDKDHRITPLRYTQEGNYVISPSASSFPVRIWRELTEFNGASKIDFLNKTKLFERPAKLKFGAGLTYKKREFKTDDFTFNSTTQIVEDGNSNNLLAENNLWTTANQSGTFLVYGDGYDPANSYDGEQIIGSVYGSAEFKLSGRFNVVAGLRLESFQSLYSGLDKNQDTNVYDYLDRAKVIEKVNLFPSLNLIYNLSDETNIRGSVSQTTARPSFKEASSAQVFDPITNRLFIGNLNLKPSYITNVDLRYENFGEQGQMYALSAFYKNFRDPIELTFFKTAPDQLTPQNLGNSMVFGIEAEFRKNLGFIIEEFKHLQFNLNVSLIESQLNMSESEYQRRLLAARDGETIEKNRQLQGQAPFLINSGLDYSNPDNGFQIGVFFNVQGESLEVVGTGIVPDVYSQPFMGLNATASKTFGSKNNSKISLKMTNLLNEKRESVYQSFGAQSQLFSQRQPGSSLALSYGLSF